jgi:lysophospholipid acyltransferase (LPLAT)-like uncharacterized protein
MKLRQPWLIGAAAFLAAKLIRVWIWTLRYRYHHLGPDIRPTTTGPEERFIYAFWHENMLVLAYYYGRPDVWILISHHADGQLITEITGRLGFRAVRGSTTRGGAEAVRQMFTIGRRDHIAITPDGPRGPRRQVQQGLVYMAAKTGLPIVLGGIGYKRCWRMRSWDRFALPYPFTRATCVASAPIRIPSDLDRESMESYRKRIEEALEAISITAEKWAETGKLGEIPPCIQSLSSSSDSIPPAKAG